MAAGARGQPHIDRSHLKLDGLTGAKCPFHKGKVFVAAVHCFFIGSLSAQIRFI
jgi:hypothetical protein